MEAIKGFLVVNYVLPILILLTGLALLWAINNLPFFIRLKLDSVIKDAEIFLAGEVGVNYVEASTAWQRALLEALKGDLSEDEVMDFIKGYIKTKVYKINKVNYDYVFETDEMKELSSKYLILTRKLKSDRIKLQK